MRFSVGFRVQAAQAEALRAPNYMTLDIRTPEYSTPSAKSRKADTRP